MSVPSADDVLRLFELPPEAEPAARRGIWRPGGGRRGAGPRGRRRPSPLLLVVDGNALAHRVFHAVGGDDAPPEEPLARFLTVLARIATATRTTACIVGFDDPARSIRRDLHAAYKAQRPAKSARLSGYLAEVPELLGQLGLYVVVPPGLEADDVLGSAAHLACQRGVPASLVTGDRDAFALVSPTVGVWLLGNGGSAARVSPSWLAARYGVPPAAYLDFAALRGDTSDNLPGVRGIGQMTAARLLAAYPSVDAALADPDGLVKLLGPYLSRVLLDNHDVLMRNREVMRIRTDVSIDLDACNQPLDRPVVAAALAARGLEELTDRVAGAFAGLGRAAWRRALPPA
jgi:DNA polymerase-1